jgi:hypothetical protein
MNQAIEEMYIASANKVLSFIREGDASSERMALSCWKNFSKFFDPIFA